VSWRQNTIPVIRAIYYPGTATGYWFEDGDSYSPYGMIRKVSERRGMTFDGAPWDQQGNIGAGVMSREMTYNYPQSGGSYSDMPTYTQMTEDWAGRVTDAAPVTSFSVVPNGGTLTTTITRPDGAQLAQVTDNNQSSATYGMLLEDSLTRDGAVLSGSKAFWQIGDYNSPRPWRTEATDERGRMTATTYNYDPGYGSRYNSVIDARAYGYSGELLRRTHTEYLSDGNYNGSLQNSGTLWWKQGGGLYGGPIWSGSHIFNLVTLTEMYAGDDATRLSRTEYQYDGYGLMDNPGIVQYNSWYNPHTPDQVVCEDVPDPTDVDCTGCPPPPRECQIGDGICNYNRVCNSYQQYDSRTLYRGNVTQDPVTGRDGFDNLAYSAVNNRIISPGLMNMKTGLKKSKKTVRKTTRKKSSEPIVEMGSGNIWTDLGFPDAEERQAKALLSDAIEEAIKHRRLTQTQAAVILRVDQSKVSKIVRGRVSHYSLDRLIRFLNALDRDVDIVIRPKAKSRKKAALKVIAASRVA